MLLRINTIIVHRLVRVILENKRKSHQIKDNSNALCIASSLKNKTILDS